MGRRRKAIESKRMARRQEIEEIRQVARPGWPVLLVALSLLVGLSQWSYHWTDISALESSPQYPPHNLIGPVGAWIAFLLLMTFGVAAYLLPLLGLAAATYLWLRPGERIGQQIVWGTVFIVAVAALLDLQRDHFSGLCTKLNLGPLSGGLLGYGLAHGLLVRLFKNAGATVIGLALLLFSLVMIVGRTGVVRFLTVLRAGGNAVYGKVRESIDRQLEQVRARRDREEVLEDRRERLRDRLNSKRPHARPTPPVDEPRVEQTAEPPAEAEPESEEPEKRPEKRPKKRISKRKRARAEVPAEEAESPADATQQSAVEYQIPPISLLTEASANSPGAAAGDLEATAQLLEETLKEFGIEAEVTDVQQGPVVTRYELRPAPGIRVERFAKLSNNIALALKATSVRVQAPVPGKGVVGIEVPNQRPDLVRIREVLEGELPNIKADLPLILGHDVSGKRLVVDLAAMPHLLIAGATGSGKTVCMNAILGGLLLTRTPEQLRLMLIDPKIVEFSAYNGIPHLVVPVVTDPKKVAIGLRWAISEMELRYKMFAKVGVRNIKAFNSRPQIEQQDLFGSAADPEKKEIPDRVPYVVIVIDELADLMLVAQSDVENGIARLAQLSRAVGIHMIIATQRPSVNVITGTIKANFPARIAFQVAQKVDSRTIIDTVGAEKLVGRGDMLYHPPGSSKMVRAQGAMITDEEIHRVIEAIKEQGEPVYEAAIHEKIKSDSVATPELDESDEYLEQAVAIIRETSRASTSSLQRRLRIGYNRAARLMDVLEQRGVVGPTRGAEPREILIDLDAEVEDSDPQEDENLEQEDFEDEEKE